MLSTSLQHLTQFLEHTQKTRQPIVFAESALRLFNQKIKSTPYVAAGAYEKMLIDLTPILVHLHHDDTVLLYDYIKNCLWDSFCTQFDILQAKPRTFFERIARSIDEKAEDMVNKIRYTSVLLRFLSATTDRLIWCPTDQLGTWHSFNTIGTLLMQLHKQK